MNVHDTQRYGPRPKGYKARNTAKPPRQRENLTTNGCGKGRSMANRLSRQKNFPGGKRLRRALAELHLRWDNYTPTSKPSGFANTRAGTMQS